ncbi:MAG: ChbG/HpnK family deacetylase [Candidatus Adiutrix sp.]|nr:ChbG/HpnK family deacetylase [Candidatus Adiutrix sp.]
MNAPAARRPRLIVNADDFGVSPGVNRAVAAAYDQGRLNSASLIINAAHAEEALALARARPGLEVGLHLNLTAQMGQKPAAPPARVPLLTDSAGRLKHGFVSLLLLSLLRPEDLRAQVAAEMRAQVELALAKGLSPAHLDSHRHAHMIPLLFEEALKIKRDYGLNRLRSVNEDLRATRAGAGLGPALVNGGLIKFLVLKTCGLFHSEKSETYFYSILHGTRLYGRHLGRVLVPARHPAVELCFHPGRPEEDMKTGEPGLAAYLLFSPDRQREYEALLDPGLESRVCFLEPRPRTP